MACGPQVSSDYDVHMQAVWNQDGKAYVQWSPKLQQLGEGHFPLRLSIGPLSPKASLPPGEGSSEYSITRETWKETLQVTALPSEAGLVLRNQRGEILDRVTFVGLPQSAVLVRSSEKEEFCEQGVWLQNKTCRLVQRTTFPDRLRHIRNLDEFKALADARGSLGLQTQAMKFVIDLTRDQLTHFLQSKKWDLHYTFVREAIESKPHLDRCDKEQDAEFNRGWYEFSEVNYARVGGREFLLGTLLLYPGTQAMSLEFATGDTISGQQMVQAYYIVRRALDPRIALKIRPTSPTQLERLQTGAKDFQEIMPVDEPYKNTTLQLLSPGVAYGTLKAFSNAELAADPLGLRVIALLKEVPNDINFVGGIISSQFQSSLSHINVLSRNRGTPHLVLRKPLENKDLTPLLGKLVRLEVTDKGYTLREAKLSEAEAFWKQREGQRKPFTPSLDLTVKGVVDLKDAQVSTSVAIGAKAANLAELARVDMRMLQGDVTCKQFASHGLARTPAKPFAIPFYWYMEHLKRADLDKLLDTYHNDPRFLNDTTYRREKLEAIRNTILTTPINPDLKALLEQEIRSRFGDRAVRFRSSTNVEDLPDFNGAGLYLSLSVELGHEKKTIERGLREVWASLWRERAWNERAFYKVDHSKAAMGILVHPSFPDEAANGVAVSSNIFTTDPNNWDTYVAVQQGETSIVNPTGDITPDQFLIRWYIPPELYFLSRSSLTAGQPVLSRQESLLLGCYMRAIKTHFQPMLGEEGKRFAMEAEFKIDGNPRQLFLKQTRPYVFGETLSTNHCK